MRRRPGTLEDCASQGIVGVAGKFGGARARVAGLGAAPGRAQPTGFGAIGGAPGLRGLTPSGGDGRGGCVAKLATYRFC
jgi:hypothetical protein